MEIDRIFPLLADDLTIANDLVDTHGLKRDPYVAGPDIYRAGTRFFLNGDGEIIQRQPDFHPDLGRGFLYELAESTNRQVKSSQRMYAWLAPNCLSGVFYQLMAKGIDIVNRYYAVTELTVQVLVYKPTKGNPSLPTPTTVHHDEIEFTSVTVFDRLNIEGDWFLITDRGCIDKDPQEVKESNIIKKLQLEPSACHTVIFDDSKYGHAVSPMHAIGGSGRRGVLLIDYMR